jgi:hypothetical protein
MNHNRTPRHNRTDRRGDIYLLLKGDLADWERDFLKSANRRLESLTERQARCLDRICDRYFRLEN